jgi:hypothetical protein
MTCVEDIDFSLRHLAAIGLRFRKLERQIVFAQEDEKPRLLHIVRTTRNSAWPLIIRA